MFSQLTLFLSFFFLACGKFLFEYPYGDKEFLQKPLFSGDLPSIYISFIDRLSQCDPAGPEESPHLIIPLLNPFPKQPLPLEPTLSHQGKKASVSFAFTGLSNSATVLYQGDHWYQTFHKQDLTTM